MLKAFTQFFTRLVGRRVKDRLMWKMDLMPHVCGEFSMAVVQANNALEDQSQVFTSDTYTLVGIFDGHGGPATSRFVNQKLIPILHETAVAQGQISTEAIQEAFRLTEEEFLTFVESTPERQRDLRSVGSCCIVGAITSDVLYVANLGDSRAVLGRIDPITRNKNAAVRERLTTDHNVSDVDVRAEVQALHPNDPDIVTYTNNAWRVKGIIQVSRAIGDVHLKRPEYFAAVYPNKAPLTQPVVTAVPSVRVKQIEEQDLFVIFATDGLWEHLTDQNAVDIVSKNPRPGIAKKLVKAAVKAAARRSKMSYSQVKKTVRGSRRPIHDDISVVVIYLDHKQNSGFATGSTSAPEEIATRGAPNPYANI